MPSTLLFFLRKVGYPWKERTSELPKVLLLSAMSFFQCLNLVVLALLIFSSICYCNDFFVNVTDEFDTADLVPLVALGSVLSIITVRFRFGLGRSL